MIVVFDMDECIASLSKPCFEYHMYLNKGVSFPEYFTQNLRTELLSKYLRPGIIDVLSTLYDCRKNSKILPVSHIVLMTNATNRDNWVKFVTDIIDDIVTIDKKPRCPLFDILLPRDSDKRLQITKYAYKYYGGQQPKFMTDVYSALKCSLEEPIVMYDDKEGHIVPANGSKNFITKVSPYHFYQKERHNKFQTFSEFFPPLVQAWMYENRL